MDPPLSLALASRVPQEVKDNNDKRDDLVAKAASIGRDVAEGIVRLKDCGRAEQISRLKSELKEFEK